MSDRKTKSFSKLKDVLSALPVNTIADDVVAQAKNGGVSIVSAKTGSGKTLMVPAQLADDTGEQVVVCVPRRFLASNAAETVAEITGLTLGEEVGFAVGERGGEKESNFGKKTKLLFVTNGYALSSGLVHTAKNIIMDETHESTMDGSILRALLHRRMENGDPVRVMEMSATMNAKKQAKYWSDVVDSKVFEASGTSFPCTETRIPAGEGKIADTTVAEFTEHGCKGVLVFRPGHKEVAQTALDIRAAANKASEAITEATRKRLKADNSQISEKEMTAGIVAALKEKGLYQLEIQTITGEDSAAERAKKTRAPINGGCKVLVGTNVIESGVNMPWVDSGVSCGTAKENSTVRETGAVDLKLVDMAQWRLDQQRGRVNRFGPGRFTLVSETPYDKRPVETVPEIERLPLTQLVMHCASAHINPLDLKFDAKVDHDRLIEARDSLQRLGLIDDQWQLTEAGEYVSRMPLGPEAGAMLWHARKMGVLKDAIPLVAIAEIGSLRADFRFNHGKDRSSDILDGLYAFKELQHPPYPYALNQANISYKNTRNLCADWRVAKAQ